MDEEEIEVRERRRWDMNIGNNKRRIMKVNNVILFATILYFLFSVPSPLSPLLYLHAEPPVKFTYQGNIRQQGILVSGQRNMNFYIYDSSYTAAPLWSGPGYNVSVSTGVFRVLLEPNLSQNQWNSSELWLEIEIEGVKLSPREQITSSIYAINSALHSGKKYTTSISPPTTPALGDLWYDSAANMLKYWNGSIWLGGGGTEVDPFSIHIQETLQAGATFYVSSGTVNYFTVNNSFFSNAPGIFNAPLNVLSSLGIYSPRLELSPLLSISSASISNYGGVYVSTHIYTPGNIYANRFIGDGSGLTNLPVSSGDNLGNHIATTTLSMSNFPIINVSSMNITGSGVASGPLFQVASSTMVILNDGKVGIGTQNPSAKLEVDGSENSGEYITIYKAGSKVAAWIKNK
ncbi:MAG: hypothetical protein Fur0012_10920 [Elusimicrobiota bacterium]